jgi:hypothetical protein
MNMTGAPMGPSNVMRTTALPAAGTPLQGKAQICTQAFREVKFGSCKNGVSEHKHEDITQFMICMFQDITTLPLRTDDFDEDNVSDDEDDP